MIDLTSFLSAIDQRLLEYADDHGKLTPETLRRLHRHAVALAEGSTTPALLTEDWPDFYDLMPAYIAGTGNEELESLYDRATFYGPSGVAGDTAFTDADRYFVAALVEDLERVVGEPDL